jgi:hypothetical protein
MVVATPGYREKTEVPIDVTHPRTFGAKGPLATF